MDASQSPEAMEWNGRNIWYCLKALRSNPRATWNDTYESIVWEDEENDDLSCPCLLYTSPSPRD